MFLQKKRDRSVGTGSEPVLGNRIANRCEIIRIGTGASGRSMEPVWVRRIIEEPGPDLAGTGVDRIQFRIFFRFRFRNRCGWPRLGVDHHFGN